MSEWITTEDIPGEAWRRVLEFANIDFATAAISAMHDSPTSKSDKANYKKQTEQIRVSILQSKEYFEAAKAATIFTSPNHLYYGMISLASAIMLLRGTGDDSLDRLRQDKKNSAHGLNFTTDASKKSASEKMRLLSDSYIEVTPAGFFLNWYKTLPSVCKICAVATEKRNNIAVRGRREKGSEKVISTDKIVGSKASILGLFGRLPDMSHSLIRCGRIVSISKASFETKSVISEMDSKTETFIWRIHGAPNPEALEAILCKFRSRYGLNHLWQLTDFEGQVG